MRRAPWVLVPYMKNDAIAERTATHCHSLQIQTMPTSAYERTSRPRRFKIGMVEDQEVGVWNSRSTVPSVRIFFKYSVRF
jgi:hypothetical protein